MMTTSHTAYGRRSVSAWLVRGSLLHGDDFPEARNALTAETLSIGVEKGAALVAAKALMCTAFELTS